MTQPLNITGPSSPPSSPSLLLPISPPLAAPIHTQSYHLSTISLLPTPVPSASLPSPPRRRAPGAAPFLAPPPPPPPPRRFDTLRSTRARRGRAVVYRIDPSVTRLEYCTTLESPGLEKLSSDLSKTRASSIGITVTKAVKDFPLGTPVQISMDVYRKKKRLKLEGIIKTVITIACNKCGGPATKYVFSDFQLLLLLDPIEASDNVFVGSFYGDQVKRRSSEGVEEEDDDEDMVDFDDRLYFPVEEKVIDISKPIRDTVHVEIAINEACDPACKGGCLQCRVNLSRGPCRCGTKQGVFGSVAVTGNQVSMNASICFYV